MSIEAQFVDFPKSDDVRNVVFEKFEECLTHYQLANEIHLNLVFKHVHFTTIELSINVAGDKLHENIHVSGTDVPHTIDLGLKKLKAVLHKVSDKKKSKSHAGRERRGRGKTDEFEPI